MRLLLDTHAWIWSQCVTRELGRNALKRLQDEENTLYIASISTLELARLVHGGRITLKGTVDTWVKVSLQALRCETLVMDHDIAMGAYQLPGVFHRDPADRVIVATAIHHDLTLLTADQRMLDYPHVHSVDARG